MLLESGTGVVLGDVKDWKRMPNIMNGRLLSAGEPELRSSLAYRVMTREEVEAELSTTPPAVAEFVVDMTSRERAMRWWTLPV